MIQTDPDCVATPKTFEMDREGPEAAELDGKRIENIVCSD